MQIIEKKQKIQSYENTDVKPEESIEAINNLLQKFGAANVWWNMMNLEKSYILFENTESNQRLIFKVRIPYITKSGIYQQAQSLRIVYHKLKALMIDFELGDNVYEIFANNLVIDSNGSEPISISEKNTTMLAEGRNLALEYKKVG